MPNLHAWVEAFAGLGLFLFGMLYIEEQIRRFAGRGFKNSVQNATRTQRKSLLVGLTTTAIFQSSSVVTLMALSLIGAGLIDLSRAIAIIFGANIGTTVTAWIAGFIGFKMDIKFMSYLVVGLGGLGSVLFGKKERLLALSRAMLAFGLIFLGLEGMKESFTAFAQNVQLDAFVSAQRWQFALLGFAITAIVQSSSATIAIAQSALYAQMISLESAAAFVIGANVGTTVTAVLGAIGGSADKKRTAVAHLLFNLFTGIIAFVFIEPLLAVTTWVMPDGDTVLKIALFHTLFNLVGVILWYPFIPILARWLKQLYQKKKGKVTRYLHNVSATLPSIALTAIEKELGHLAEVLERFALQGIGISDKNALQKESDIETFLQKAPEFSENHAMHLYRYIHRLEGEILRFITQVAHENNDPIVKEKLNRMLRAATYLATAAKAIKDMQHDLVRWSEGSRPQEETFLRNLRYQILKSTMAFHEAITTHNQEAQERLEQFYRRIAASYKDTMELIGDLARDRSIPSEMTTIALNDLHLSKSFSKSLRNALNALDISYQNSDLGSDKKNR